MECEEETKAVVVLPPGAAKRLIARGVVALPPVRRALREGLVVVSLGTTNAYVAEEILGHPIDKARFRAGYVGEELATVPAEKRAPPLVLRRGEPVELSPEGVLAELSAGDVLIKGANALDPGGICGVFMGSETGGTVGRYAAAALARGTEIVIPISLAKSIHAHIPNLARALGTQRLRFATGERVGLYPLVGTVVTEAVAVELLYGVHAEHLASGGVGPGTGAVVLLLCGEGKKEKRAFGELSALVRAEPRADFG
jgi:hypothetical protein